MTKQEAITKLKAYNWSPMANVERNIDIYIMYKYDGLIYREINKKHKLALTRLRTIVLKCEKILGIKRD